MGWEVFFWPERDEGGSCCEGGVMRRKDVVPTMLDIVGRVQRQIVQAPFRCGVIDVMSAGCCGLSRQLLDVSQI